MFKKLITYLRERSHDWVYRNPYDRTCKVCGRNEEQYSDIASFSVSGFAAGSWWEVEHVGIKTKCNPDGVEPPPTPEE